jgi:hypothetical protein
MRSPIEWFIVFIFIAKFMYLGMLLYTSYLKHQPKPDTKKITKFTRYETILEVIVLLCLGVLLIILFNPRVSGVVRIEGEMKTTLFLLGIVLIISVRGFWRELLQFASVEQKTV